MAMAMFQINDDGHSPLLLGWDRSCSWIEMRFVGYTRIRITHSYSFTATAKKLVEDNETDSPKVSECIPASNI